MRWKRVEKEKSKQPRQGCYKDWKKQIAKECYYKCVYCAIHESDFGGIRNFHVEHYKPKSHPEYKKLINDIKNLFYACSICNTFKSHDWPGDPSSKHSNPSYPNPSLVDYNELFVCKGNGELEGKFVASRYILSRLYLNRSQLIFQRRKHLLINRLMKCSLYFNNNLNKLEKYNDQEKVSIISDYARLTTKLMLLQNKISKERPYEMQDIKKS